MAFGEVIWRSRSNINMPWKSCPTKHCLWIWICY